jgi:hypothetical protein
MFRVFTLISLTAILLSGCAPSAAPIEPTAASAAIAEAPATTDCAVTSPIKDQPPKDPNADPFGFGYWYVNEDRTIWVGLPESQSWRAGSEKVIWIRPQGTDLVITGHRLDAEGPPLRADIPCCYLTGFQVTGLIFPTEGCWEVTAKAGESELKFVTQVKPADKPATSGSCASLAEVVKQSDAIVVGRITETDSDGRYAWHNIIPMGIWKPDRNIVGDRFSLLQDFQVEPKMEKNKTYLLFLQSQPWRIVCAQQTLMAKEDTQAVPLGGDPFWPGGAMRDLELEVNRLAGTP